MSTDPRERALAFLNGFRVFKLVSVAVALGIPERLVDGAKTADELARETGANADALRRALRALAAQGALREEADGRFAATDVTPLLRRGVSGALGDVVVMLDREGYRAWAELEHTLRTGEAGYPRAYGMSHREHLRNDPEGTELFNRAMVSLTTRIAEAVARAYDFSRARLVADVGGGNGALLIGVLRAHPHLRGLLVDIETGLRGAREVLIAAGVADRCELRVSDFFVEVPRADVYLLKSILHDWPDADAARILATCRRSMGPDARLLAVERRLPDRVSEDPPSRNATIGDVHMLVLFGSRERTAAEYAALFASAGLRAGAVIPVDPEWAIFEAVPA